MYLPKSGYLATGSKTLHRDVFALRYARFKLFPHLNLTIILTNRKTAYFRNKTLHRDVFALRYARFKLFAHLNLTIKCVSFSVNCINLKNGKIRRRC